MRGTVRLSRLGKLFQPPVRLSQPSQVRQCHGEALKVFFCTSFIQSPGYVFEKSDIHTYAFSGVGEREWGWCCFRTRSHLLEASVANNCKDVHGSVWGCVKKFGSKQPSPKRTWLIIKAAPCSLDNKDIVCLRMITKLWRATCSGTSSVTKLWWATCSRMSSATLTTKIYL